MRGTGRFCYRICLVAGLLGAFLISPPSALAQKKDKKAPKDEQAQPAASDQPSAEDMARVRQLAQEAAAAESNGALQEAVDKYQQVYDIVPDPNLLIKIGDLHRQNADDDKALEAWATYQEKAPALCEKLNQATCEANKDNAAAPCAPKYGDDGVTYEACVPRYAAEVEERISVITKEREEKAQKEKEEAERIAREAEEKRKAEEEQKRIEAAKLPMALSAILMLGADERTTVLGRLLAGGMLRFGRFAPEAHIAFEGFLRASGDKGTQAQSFTLLDLGARYAFQDDQFVGPFAGFGGGFGLFLGSPRDVNLTDEPASCAGFEGNNCTVQVNRHLNGRVGVGWGFRSGDKATVAVRLDYNLWWYSVDDDQPDGVPASQVEKPLLAHAVTVGLEFIRWR